MGKNRSKYSEWTEFIAFRLLDWLVNINNVLCKNTQTVVFNQVLMWPKRPQYWNVLLQRWPLLTQLRQKPWHWSVSLLKKLYGNVDDLRRSANFVPYAGLQIKLKFYRFSENARIFVKSYMSKRKQKKIEILIWKSYRLKLACRKGQF